MPALVNNKLVSSTEGTKPALGRIKWPCLRKKERNDERNSDVGDTCAGATNGGKEDDAAELDDDDDDDAAAEGDAETEAAGGAAAVDSARRCDPVAVDAAV